MAFADDYVGVNERVDAFNAKYPEGRIQTEIARLTDSLVVMKAIVYRDASDPLPTIAHSQLGIPGKTNFTRDSEVENAETSAVGRALAFLGFETKRGIGSRDEVDSRRPAPAQCAPTVTPPPAEDTPTAVVPSAEALRLNAWLGENGWAFADEHVVLVLAQKSDDPRGVNVALDQWFGTHPAAPEQQWAALTKQIRDMRIELDKSASSAAAGGL